MFVSVCICVYLCGVYVCVCVVCVYVCVHVYVYTCMYVIYSYVCVVCSYAMYSLCFLTSMCSEVFYSWIEDILAICTAVMSCVIYL